MRTFVCPEAKEEKRNGPPEREVRRAQGGDETVGVRTACCFRKKATAGISKEGGTFSPATCSIITTLESLMFGTWASYESTRAFVTSSFLWQRRGSDFPLLARILPEMMKTTRFLAGLPLEKVILAKRCHYPQPRPPRDRTARPVAGRLLAASPPTNKKAQVA